MSAFRSAFICALVLAIVSVGVTADAQTLNKCSSKKKGCVAKKAAALLKCHIKAEKGGVALDGTCITKAEDKFDGGADPTKGCFEKLENKQDPMKPETMCLTQDDTGALETKIDAFVLDVVQELDPGYPAPVLNKCSAAKKKCVSKKMKALLKCHSKAEKKGLVLDGLCVQKAEDKFDGGADPTKGCFEKEENKPGAVCLTSDDTAALEFKVDAFVNDVVSELDPNFTTPTPFLTPTPTATPTLTPTPTPTATCNPPGTVYSGSLIPTKGRFNYPSGIGLAAASAECNSHFLGSHACTYFELLCAQGAPLVGATDTASNPVASFWAIDPGADPVARQCHDDQNFPCPGGICPPGHTWEYGTAHTPSRGQMVTLNGITGMLGPLQTGEQCALVGTTRNVGCCQ